ETKAEPAANMNKETEEIKPPVKEERKPTASEESHKDVIRARSETLSGPKVVGKIQLPVERKPIASSSGPSHSNDNKRKRKRSNKNTPVNPNAAEGQRGGNEGNANRSSGGGFNKGTG